MEKILQALNDAGYFVHIHPGKVENGQQVDGGCTVFIMNSRFMQVGIRNEQWEGHGPTAYDALGAACAQLHQHVRPAYDGYLALADAFGWEK